MDNQMEKKMEPDRETDEHRDLRELNLSYPAQETLLCTMCMYLYTHYGNSV